MIITNEWGLPKPFENIAKNPTYSKGKAHLSATQLLNSPKIVALMKKHDGELTQDVADTIWSIFGSAVHSILEKGGDENHIVEERFFAELDGWSISGAVDLQVIDSDGIHIQDYKTTSVWAVRNDKPEWEQQLNIYAWLIAFNKKVQIKSLTIVGILKDWSKSEADRNPEYPQKPVAMVDVPLWTYEEQENFIKGRIAKHSAADFAMETNGELADCTPGEMWEKPPVWAVIKQGAARAKSLHDAIELAEAAKKELGAGYEIQLRRGKRGRCESYCLVNKWCKQYQQYKEENP